jgi:hypothetical protein
VKYNRYILLFTSAFLSSCLYAQVKYSLATDLSLLHNFDGKQKFTVIGQTIIPQWHFTKKHTLYAWFSYHSNGKYKSNLSAEAKSSSTVPQSFSFTSRSEMRLRHFSLGIKRYFYGSAEKLEKFNLYGAAGFGLTSGTATNNFSAAVDTSLYLVQDNILGGSGNFKRLTFDITAGWELPVGYEIFIFSEARILLPTTSYSNGYLLKNKNAPLPGTINFGIRVLFNSEQ